MNWLMARYYDKAMQACEHACLADWRRALLANLEGTVLEVGAGTGANLPYYPDTVERLLLCEPTAAMRMQLETKLDHPRYQLLDCKAESLPLPDESVDVVVSTLVLCSVQSLSASLAELHRVTVPGGRLVFVEHVAAMDRPGRLRWQRVAEPMWRCIAGNCHLTRDTERAITDSGWRIQTIQRESMRKAMALVRPSIRGVAIKSPKAPRCTGEISQRSLLSGGSLTMEV
jgi:ubiquinone/menaquinone biosynthesis C-methylase UbiE